MNTVGAWSRLRLGRPDPLNELVWLDLLIGNDAMRVLGNIVVGEAKALSVLDELAPGWDAA